MTTTVNHPWRCLKRGFFLLITNKTPLRLTILQSTLLFLIDALTFMLLRLKGGAFKDYLYLKIILPRDKSYGLISTPTLSPGKILI